MKKYVVLVIFISSLIVANAQKENGIVYKEHAAIEKTKSMWHAIVKGDKEAFTNLFSDTVSYFRNGELEIQLKKNLGEVVEWWLGVEQLSVTNDEPAFPDAINYLEGGLWVQDWIRIKGIHKKTGIRINIPVHNLYHFKKDGKISVVCQYYDNKVFVDIFNSQRTLENGIVYINHPYIITVRKLINALCAEDFNMWSSFFSPKATFVDLESKVGAMVNYDEKTAQIKQVFAMYNNIDFKQIGYPDCVYYEKDDVYTVYSWWSLSFVTINGVKKSEIPIMFTHSFNKDGLILYEFVCFSSNHFK